MSTNRNFTCFGKNSCGSDNFTELEEVILSCMENFVQTPQFLDAVMERIKGRIESLEDQIATLKYESFTKEKLVQYAYERLDSLERISRMNNLKITGVAESENENTFGIVVNLFKHQLHLDIPMESIECTFRLGTARNGKSRPIMVRFSRYNDRNRVYKKKSLLKGTSIVVREDLSKPNQQLFNSAMSKFDHRNVWTQDGHIYIKTDDGVVHFIKNNADIENLTATNK